MQQVALDLTQSPLRVAVQLTYEVAKKWSSPVFFVFLRETEKENATCDNCSTRQTQLNQLSQGCSLSCPTWFNKSALLKSELKREG